jgi:hypothetical protein
MLFETIIIGTLKLIGFVITAEVIDIYQLSGEQLYLKAQQYKQQQNYDAMLANLACASNLKNHIPSMLELAIYFKEKQKYTRAIEYYLMVIKVDLLDSNNNFETIVNSKSKAIDDLQSILNCELHIKFYINILNGDDEITLHCGHKHCSDCLKLQLKNKNFYCSECDKFIY